jgi:hypothetical protein
MFERASVAFFSIVDWILVYQLVIGVVSAALFFQNTTGEIQYTDLFLIPSLLVVIGFATGFIILISFLKISYEYQGALYDNNKKIFELNKIGVDSDDSPSELILRIGRINAIECDLLGDPYKDVFGPVFGICGLYLIIAVVWSQAVVTGLTWALGSVVPMLLWLVALSAIFLYTRRYEKNKEDSTIRSYIAQFIADSQRETMEARERTSERTSNED